jgi:hypothetical protein
VVAYRRALSMEMTDYMMESLTVDISG